MDESLNGETPKISHRTRLGLAGVLAVVVLVAGGTVMNYLSDAYVIQGQVSCTTVPVSGVMVQADRSLLLATQSGRASIGKVEGDPYAATFSHQLPWGGRYTLEIECDEDTTAPGSV